MNEKIKRVMNIVSTVVVVLAIILAILLVGVRVVGLQVFTVLSGSMEPEYHTGSLIYVRKVDTKKLEVGDDITFMVNEDTIATHRIVEILPDETDPTVIRFRTQGIANKDPDGTPVHYKNVIGQPIFTIPYLGFLSAYIQEPPGTYVAVAVGAILLILVFLPDLLFESEEEKQKKAEKESRKKGQTPAQPQAPAQPQVSAQPQAPAAPRQMPPQGAQPRNGQPQYPPRTGYPRQGAGQQWTNVPLDGSQPGAAPRATRPAQQANTRPQWTNVPLDGSQPQYPQQGNQPAQNYGQGQNPAMHRVPRRPAGGNGAPQPPQPLPRSGRRMPGQSDDQTPQG